MVRAFTRVGVVGLGTMGAGIAEVLARSGLEVVGVEVDAAGVDRARAHLTTSTGRVVAKGKLSPQEVEQVLGRDTSACPLVPAGTLRS